MPDTTVADRQPSHLHIMARSGKRQLAMHIREPHSSNTFAVRTWSDTPLAELVKWTLEELCNAHEEMHR